MTVILLSDIIINSAHMKPRPSKQFCTEIPRVSVLNRKVRKCEHFDPNNYLNLALFRFRVMFKGAVCKINKSVYRPVSITASNAVYNYPACKLAPPFCLKGKLSRCLLIGQKMKMTCHCNSPLRQQRARSVMRSTFKSLTAS